MVHTSSTSRPLVLASTSPFRRELLSRLGLPFSVQPPDVDETALPGESATALVCRLAEAKARAVIQHAPDAIIIGSDQVAVLDDVIMGKPGNYTGAMEQLLRASGRTLTFYNGLCVLDAAHDHCQIVIEPFRVVFRELTPEKVSRYLEREQPYGSAGSCKSEGLGIALFERLEGDDPTALIGLPLIRLVRMLENAGMPVL